MKFGGAMRLKLNYRSFSRKRGAREIKRFANVALRFPLEPAPAQGGRK